MTINIDKTARTVPRSGAECSIYPIVRNLRAPTPVLKLKYPRPHPGYYTMAGLRVSRKNLCGAGESFGEISEEFGTFRRISREARGFSRPAPENSLALIYSANLKKHIDKIDYALYNIVMKLRNRIQRFKAKHSLYCAKDIWERYDILITMFSFWALVLTLLALEANGVI